MTASNRLLLRRFVSAGEVLAIVLVIAGAYSNSASANGLACFTNQWSKTYMFGYACRADIT